MQHKIPVLQLTKNYSRYVATYTSDILNTLNNFWNVGSYFPFSPEKHKKSSYVIKANDRKTVTSFPDVS